MPMCPSTSLSHSPLSPAEVQRIRADFPILKRRIHSKPLVYLDNAASMQMPQSVIDRMVRYQSQEHSNVHRGVHTLSGLATDAYEEARRKVQRFINARHEHEIIFTRGATEALNLLAHSYGRLFVGAGDEILISAMEHHANIVPWQMLAEEVSATLRVIPMNDAGELDQAAYMHLLTPQTKIVSVAHVSNALGTINPIKEMITLAHAAGAVFIVDGAQAVSHLKVDVAALDADFYVFSGHKMGAPTGIGVLYGKEALLNQMKPFQGGGDMILSVTFEKTTYNVIPYKFEAGTPPIMAAIALGTAIDYLENIGLERIEATEHRLLVEATNKIQALSGIRLIGTAKHKASVLSFTVAGVHPHDVGSILDGEGIAVRAGHHCAQPVMQRMGVAATARASFAFYNTSEEVETFVAGVKKVQEIFG
jgi:cysteine desulfurase/selenocysteine lyase